MYQIACPFFVAYVVTEYQSRSEAYSYLLFRNMIHFYGELLAPPPNWRITPWLSATAYSIYSQLPSILDVVPTSGNQDRVLPGVEQKVIICAVCGAESTPNDV
jgi:hypothetical protein